MRSARAPSCSLGSEERIGADYESTCSQFGQTCENRIELAFRARAEHLELQPEGAGRSLRVARYGLGIGIGRVDEQGDDPRRGHQLVQQLQPLRPHLHVQRRVSREVAARSVHAGNEAGCNRIARYRENDRDRRGRRLCCQHSRSIGDDHRHLMTDQLNGHRRHSIVLAIRPAIFDGHVLALDIADLTEAFAERAHQVRV